MHEKSLILLDENQIKKHLKNKSVSITLLNEIDSTNAFFKKHKHDFPIAICLAETQTQGRGRLGRTWHSPFGQNIYFSMRIHFDKSANALSALSLIVALALAHTTEFFLKENTIKIKWPNDLYLNDAKFAGILIDLESMSDNHCVAIIGIGINVNMENVDEKQIDQSWTSLKKIIHHDIDRNQLCAKLIDSLINYLARFEKLGLMDFQDEWIKRDYLSGKPIELIAGEHVFSGDCTGINTQGHLLLLMPDKTQRAFSSGEACIKKYKN